VPAGPHLLTDIMFGAPLALLPTLLGPVVTAVVVVTASVAMGKHDPLVGGPFMNWLIAVLLFGVLALVLGASMLGADVLFAALGRRPITGMCAWIAGLLAPLPVAVFWAAVPPRTHQGFMFGVILVAPLLLVAGLVRLVAMVTCGR